MPGREKLRIVEMLGVLADGRKLLPCIILRECTFPRYRQHHCREIPQCNGNPLQQLKVDD
jgi:hypothetical protein